MINLPGVKEALAGLQERKVVSRIWRKDHTLWSPEPGEITNRLGWLTVTDFISEQMSVLLSFAEEIRAAGYRYAVLLGMGGASLGTEVLRRTLGSAGGYPELFVLDSTVPAWVQKVTEAIDPAHTLFLVSSKSGGTIETLSFYKHFRKLVEKSVGKEKSGQNFVVITDAGTPLSRLAEETGFRRTFLNPADVGGRFSVLSYFGMVPAALMGIDIQKLLERTDSVRKVCAPDIPARDNPGAVLGAAVGTLAQRGRDKLTLITSPSVGTFGLWVEQLIAESLGKAGKGIIPVMGEPLLVPTQYEKDRLFVYLRLEGDDNSSLDAAVKDLQSSGQPVILLNLSDCYDLGAEFYRWEFAIAVTGEILGVHPFDQPDVQAAKDATGRVLQEYQASGYLPHQVASGHSLQDLLSEAKKGDYLAIMAYALQTPDNDDVLNDLRTKVMKQYRVATTMGYGPRLLHSTGQLHKGGPDNGLFLQITVDHARDFPVPGEPYTFGVLADAQALGDYRALKSLSRRITRVHLNSIDKTTFSKLAGELD
ncbi:glucose-6-phosphate isomerase [Chloroflexota bacterium]